MNAQRFSLLPQVGFENAKTKISYNGLRSFSDVKFTPQASLRLNYASKQGHGFFLGAATSRSSILFSFADPENGMSNFKTTAANMQLQFEGGYQFNSKPISLSGSKQSSSKTKTKTSCGSGSEKNSCHKSYSSSSCSRSKSSNTSKQSTTRGSWVRIQPSVGMGLIPVVRTDVVSKTQNGQTNYEYRAGNWQTGLIAGTSFEFGNNRTRLVTVSVNYFKGLGNLNTTTLTTSDGVKLLTTNLKSSVSGWNMRVGIPFSLVKNKSAAKNKSIKSKSNGQQYRSIIRYRCGAH
jgi:hypothetical protein